MSDNTFFRCYTIIIEQMTIHTIQNQLYKLGRWPKDRIAMRVLEWEEAVTRLDKEADSALAMCRMVVAIEDPEGRLYLVRTPDLVTGIPDIHRKINEEDVRLAIDESFQA